MLGFAALSVRRPAQPTKSREKKIQWRRTQFALSIAKEADVKAGKEARTFEPKASFRASRFGVCLFWEPLSGRPEGAMMSRRLFLLTFGRPARCEAKKVSGCRAAPGKGMDGKEKSLKRDHKNEKELQTLSAKLAQPDHNRPHRIAARPSPLPPAGEGRSAIVHITCISSFRAEFVTGKRHSPIWHSTPPTPAPSTSESTPPRPAARLPAPAARGRHKRSRTVFFAPPGAAR